MTTQASNSHTLLPFPPHELTRISADTLKSWSRCKRQFVYKYVASLQWPSDNRNFSLGREVHKLLDYQSRSLNCDLLLGGASEKVALTWQKLMKHPATQWDIIASEWEFHVPFDLPIDPLEPHSQKREWLTGRMDRVSQMPDGRICIIDWKTGTSAPKSEQRAWDLWQTRLYLFALLELANSPSIAELGLNREWPLTAENICFLYLEVKADTVTPPRELYLHYSQQRHEETRQRLLNHLSSMAIEEGYALPDKCPDGYCQYRALCGMPKPEYPC